MREVIREIQTTWLAAVPAQIAARTVFKLMIMLHKLKFRHQISGVMCQNVTDYRPVIHIVTEGRAAHPNLPPDGDRIRVDISLSSTQLHTARGPARQIYGRAWKQQLAVPHEREGNLVYIQSAISSPLKP